MINFIVRLILLFLVINSSVYSKVERQEFETFLKNSSLRDVSSIVSIFDSEGVIFENYKINRLNKDIDENSIFRIASITKTFTAVAIIQLVEKGVLVLDEELVKYVPELKELEKTIDKENRITILDLLVHISGLPKMAHGIDWEVDFDELIQLTIKSKLLFKSGSSFSYSNLGYAYLGLIIERATGTSYEEYMKKNIFEPLGMTSSYFHYVNVPNKEDIIIGEDNMGRIAYEPDLKAHAAGWGMFTTIKDLKLYSRYMLGSQGAPLLSDYNLKISKQLVTYLDEGISRMTVWFSKEFDHGNLLFHTGRIDGFESSLYLDLDRKISYIVIANKFEAPVDRFIEELINFHFEK